MRKYAYNNKCNHRHGDEKFYFWSVFIMTRKEKKIAEVKAYVDYAKTVDIHQKALKGCEINFGVKGRSSEMLCKLALNNYRFKGIAEPGKSDTWKKINGEIKCIEVKTGCGELATILSTEFKKGVKTTFAEKLDCFERARKRNNCFDSDFVVYIPEPDLDFPVEYQAYVLETATFKQILVDLEMIRFKQTSGNHSDYYDRFTIVDFKTSKSRYEAFYGMLEEFGTSFDLWLEENEITDVK